MHAQNLDSDDDPNRHIGNRAPAWKRTARRGPIGKANRRRRHRAIVAAAAAAVAEELIGPFPLIYADPPWKFDTYSEKGLERTPDTPQATRR